MRTVTPNRYRVAVRNVRDAEQAVREILIEWRALRAEFAGAAWHSGRGVLKREGVIARYEEARHWRKHYRALLADMEPVKGSAWSPAACERLRARGRLKP